MFWLTPLTGLTRERIETKRIHPPPPASPAFDSDAADRMGEKLNIMSNLKKLSELDYADRYRDSTIPEYARHYRKYKDKTANDLTKSIIHWIKLHGGQAERVNTMGVPMDNTKVVTDVLGRQRRIGSIQWRRSGATPGSADIHAVVKGMYWAIEVKVGRDKQSQAQKNYQASVERAGGRYFIVRTFDEFVEKWENLLHNI